MISISSMFDELEKIALTSKGADKIRENYAKTKKRGYTDITHREGKKITLKRHAAQEVGIGEGLKRNLVATGRRLTNPKDMLRRTKQSLVGAGTPGWQKNVNRLMGGLAVANTIPAHDPSGEGKSRLRRGLEGVGGTIGGAAGKGIAGGVIGGVGGAAVGSLVGKGIDKLRGYTPPPRGS